MRKAIFVFLTLLICACNNDEPYECRRDRASLQSLNECLEHPQCKLTGDEFHTAKQLKQFIQSKCRENDGE